MVNITRREKRPHSASPASFSLPQNPSVPSHPTPPTQPSAAPAQPAQPPTADPPAPAESSRVQLACFFCRSKRVRCSGERPRCEGCIKADAVCEYPAARAKKRTKKQMEEARRMEARVAKVEGLWGDYAAQDPQYRPHPAFMSDPNLWPSAAPNQEMFWPTDPSHAAPGSASVLGSGAGAGSSSGAGAGMFLPPHPQGGGHSGGMAPPLGVGGSHAHLGTTPLGGAGAAGGQRADGAQFGQDYIWSPNTDLRLANALESQTAYINGNPAEDGDLELFYYRFSGSTAMEPGVNRIALKLQRRSDSDPLVTAPQPSTSSPAASSVPTSDLFDPTGMPHPHVWRPLFALFFKHCSQHFPSCSHQRMVERFETGTMSQFMACCICSLGVRFSPGAGDPAQAAAPFIAKAQELVTPLLHLPTHDVLTGLLYLAWANYGQNSESGLWQYSGMAIRMAIDLGAHEISEIYESPAHLARIRLLFWSLFVTDRIVAFATGRPASIPEDIIEIPLPVDEDFFPDPARNLPTSPHEEVEPVPFVQLVKLMIICGRISNVLNGRRGRARTLVSSAEPLPEMLGELQLRLVAFYSNLPPSLQWSADNFKHQHARGHGGTYLALHLWANAVLALIYHPELLKSPSGVETPLNRSMSRNVKLSLASSRQICECMVFADLVDSSAYLSTPYLTQPLFVASMAFIHEMRSLQASADPSDPSSQAQPSSADGPAGSTNPSDPAGSTDQHGNPTDLLMLSMAKQNFTALLNAVHKMEEYWAGAHYVAELLEKRSGFPRPNARALKRTFISLPDRGLLKRFTTDPQHPQSVGPPTDVSLRDAIARSERSSTAQSGSGLTPLWLSDLMTGYTVENMSFAPADPVELERLLARPGSGQDGGHVYA
ncbi:hypothetical protein IAT38_007967 [Cryptococcus sp. DSM 104549]